MKRQELLEKLAELGYGECRVEPETDMEDDYGYTVWVPRAKFAAAKNGIRGVNVMVNQETPTLVPAEPGDFVRVYSEYEGDDSESPIGIVTSRRTLDGVTVYGCSYLRQSLGNQYVSSVYTFHLSTENYGGWHRGFLVVMTPAEVKAALAAAIDRAADQIIADTEVRRERDKMQIDGLLEHIASAMVGDATIWHPPAEPTSVSVSIEIPPIHYK